MKNTFLNLLILICLNINTGEAQILKRKGLLGIMMQNVNDSIASQYQLNDQNGVLLTQVIQNGTFSKMGVQEGEILLAINDQKVNNIQDVVLAVTDLLDGDQLVVTTNTKSQVKKYTGTVVGKPKEQFSNANVTFDEVRYDGNRLRSILVTPKGVVNPPVVYFLQGFTCGSVETVSDNNPMKQLMNDWVDAGFAVFRVEKPGVGDSKSVKHCSDISFEEELRGFQEGYKALLSYTHLDLKNIFMFGHSLGGVIAPLLNKMKSPRGMMVYGTVGENWYDYMEDLYTIQPKHWGVSTARTKEDNKVNLPFNKDFLIHKLSGQELKANNAYVNFFRDGTLDFDNERYIGRHFDFWQNLADVEIQDMWAQVKTNVLAMYGEFDIQAINPKGTQIIRDIVNQNGGKAQFKLIPNADHGFVNFDSMGHNVRTLNSGQYGAHAFSNYSQKLGQETVNWMTGLLHQS